MAQPPITNPRLSPSGPATPGGGGAGSPTWFDRSDPGDNPATYLSVSGNIDTIIPGFCRIVDWITYLEVKLAATFAFTAGGAITFTVRIPDAGVSGRIPNLSELQGWFQIGNGTSVFMLGQPNILQTVSVDGDDLVIDLSFGTNFSGQISTSLLLAEVSVYFD